MENYQQDFLQIIKSAIHHLPLRLTEAADYGKILALAREQNLLALVGEKLCESAEFRASAAYGKAIAATVGLVAGQVSRTETFLQLYRKFEKAGIRPLVMKGIICRELYGEFRDHRPSGDEDLLIRPGDFPALRQVMEENGMQMEREIVSEQELEMLQEITFEDRNAELHIEVHTNPMGIGTWIRRKMNRYFTDVFERACAVRIDNTEIWTMHPSDHLLFLVLHAFKHLMTGGIGIRQALDIYMFLEQYRTAIDWDYLRKALRETKAEKFFVDLLAIGNHFLGFEFEIDGEPDCPEILLEDMLENGVFGNETQAQRTAASMTAAAIREGKSYSKTGAVLRAIFPNRRILAAGYPVLVRKPWMLPVCWCIRWGRFLRHNRENGGGLARASVSASQKRIDILKSYGIIMTKNSQKKK